LAIFMIVFFRNDFFFLSTAGRLHDGTSSSMQVPVMVAGSFARFAGDLVLRSRV